MKVQRLRVDAEVIRNPTAGYTIKMYVPVPNQTSMDKLYYTGHTVTHAMSKARAAAKANNFKLTFYY